ncbi:HAMP domain-containing sensor histidine kinase [Maribacter luteus]|uniref:HAMP domain-containing sensor histidine kinase n=1 Tax=Maribacter luteus TaxID=2594478 RepID=UPI0024927B1D|nr:HAMP domain-containing sensor histidine kinase [Maribacter luteus]
MKIRSKILIYFSSTVIVLVAFAMAIIFLLFSEYREEQFQQQQYGKIQYTLKLINRYKELSAEVSLLLDEQDINDFYDEKLLVFDVDKRPIFSSLDNLSVKNIDSILSMLSPNKNWLEGKEDNYDVIGVYLENDSSGYYAISKAYDAFGYDKMNYLRNLLFSIFIVISIVVLLVSFYLSKKISGPIASFAENLKHMSLTDKMPMNFAKDDSSYELSNLTEKFNQLLERTQEAFSFQKHSVQHISHELKTPLAVLLSELERLTQNDDLNEVRASLDKQIIMVKSLGDTINILLDITKYETGDFNQSQPIRVDELLFDIISEINTISPDFEFEVEYYPKEIYEERLIVLGNERLLRQAFGNLLNNAVSYSMGKNAQIKMDCSDPEQLKITIANNGKSITEEEQKHLFTHFFRGGNSQKKRGYGLGLALTKRILELHSGSITYASPKPGQNVFTVSL